MLPFLKPKHSTGLIVSYRKPDGGKEESHMEGDEDAGLHACSEDLIRAITAKDTIAVTKALKDAFEILDSQPHEEGPHTNESESTEE